MNPAFEANKVKRLINTQGLELTFKRKAKNSFGEEVDEELVELPIKGVYHVMSSYITVKEGDATRSQKKPIPMFLVLYDEYMKHEEPIKMDDLVVHNGQSYRVTGSTNVQEANFAIDISLELIL